MLENQDCIVDAFCNMDVLYIFPIYDLFLFSNNMKRELQINNADYLTIFFRLLKSHYKFIGILL